MHALDARVAVLQARLPLGRLNSVGVNPSKGSLHGGSNHPHTRAAAVAYGCPLPGLGPLGHGSHAATSQGSLHGPSSRQRPQERRRSVAPDGRCRRASSAAAPISDRQYNPRRDGGSLGSATSRQRLGADPLHEHGYATLGPIAAGAFSQVQRARHMHHGTEVAVKTYSKTKCAKLPHLATAMKSELEALQTLQGSSHAHLANLLEVCESRVSLHAMLEYCCGGSLHRRLKDCRAHRVGLPEPQAVAIARQLTHALRHIHSHGVVHRDVKPENVLFTNQQQDVVKLCDFGFAKVCGNRRLRTVCGSPQYMAPEINGRESYVGAPVDLWALGALLYEVLHARPAFTGGTLEQLGMRVLKASHQPFEPFVSAAGKAFIKAVLQAKPEKRSTADHACCHTWIQEKTPPPPPELRASA